MTDNQNFCLKIVELEITLGFFRVRNLEKGMPKSLLGLMAKNMLWILMYFYYLHMWDFYSTKKTIAHFDRFCSSYSRVPLLSNDN